MIGVGPDLPAYDFEGLRRDLLLDGGLLVAVPADHRFAYRGTIPVTELRDEPWIVGKGLRDDPQFGAWPTLDHPRIAYAVREWPTRLGLVATGLGIAVLPEVAAPRSPPESASFRSTTPPGSAEPSSPSRSATALPR